MTGPDGSSAEPTSGITGSLQWPRVFYFLLFGLGLWLVMTVVRKTRSGELTQVSSRSSRFVATWRTTWDGWLQAPGTRWALGIVSLVATVVLALLVAVLTGPVGPNKVSESGLAHQLRFSYTYGYLLMGIVLWRLCALRVLERHGLREEQRAKRGPLHATLVVVGCLAGGLVLSVAANPWLHDRFEWSHLGFGTNPSIWGQWPTYFFLVGALIVARLTLRNEQRRARTAARGTTRRFATPQLTLMMYVTILFIAIEWPKFLAPLLAEQHHRADRDLRVARPRPQRRRRLRRAAGPRLRRVLGRRRVHDGVLHGSPPDQAALRAQRLLHHPLRDPRCDDRRRLHRAHDAPIAR